MDHVEQADKAFAQRAGLYAEEHNVFSVLQGLLKQVVMEQAADPYSFMIEALESDLPPRYMLYAPPGAGGESLAERLAEETGKIAFFFFFFFFFLCPLSCGGGGGFRLV